MRLTTYIFYVNECVNSGNRRLCQGSTQTSLDLLEQHFHTIPGNYEYVFGLIRRERMGKG
jgi:hypothetical protein